MGRKVSVFLILIPLFVYVILALLYIYIPGINSDEILFGNAAVGVVNNDTHIYIKIGNFPVLLMPYIGALKSYLYYPIFKIFGVSILSIRIPMILLSVFTLYLVYRIMLISTKSVYIAFFATLFLATHASFIAYTRADQGPLAIELFLKSLALWLFLKFIADKKPKHLVWLPLVISLGIFNKLNFIWTLNAFIAGVIIFYKDILDIILKGSRRDKFNMIFFPVITVLISFSYYLFLTSKLAMLKSYFPEDISLRFIGERLLSIYDLLYHNFRGVVFLSYMYENPISFTKITYASFLPSTSLYGLTRWNFVICLLVIAMCFIISLYRFFIKDDDKPKYTLFFIIIFLMMIAQIILVTNATAGWHLFSVYPMLVLALFGSAALLFKSRLVQGGLFALLIIGNINDYSFNISAFEHLRPMNVWTTKINDLIDYTRKTDAKFYQITWGTDDQLITFTRQKNKFFKTYEYGDEMFAGKEKFENIPEARKHLFENSIRNKYQDSYYIVSWQKNLWFGNFHIFEQTLEENDLTYEVTKNFYDKEEVIYSILKVKKKNL